MSSDYVLQLYPENIDMYQCSCCKATLPSNFFHSVPLSYKPKFKRNSTARPVASRCKNCLKQVVAQRSIQYSLWISARARSRKNGLEFSIEVEDILVPQFCPVFNIELRRNSKYIGFDSATLDRIDNARGYTKDNIQVLSYLANTMKNQATPEQLILFADWVKANYA